MSGTSVSESRTYNANGQLTQLTGIGMNLVYSYSSTANNGQIASQQDLVSGETITYQYDSLKRLSSATSTQGWGQGFGYDGFGNLTAKSALSGTPPVGVFPADPATNRLSGGSYDANGNQLYGGNGSTLTYDVANRMTSSANNSSQGIYQYSPSNKRVYQLRQHYNGSNWITDSEEFYFYSVSGQRLGTYWTTVNGSIISWNLSTTQVFFKGKLIQRGGGSTQEDIRASIGRYFPYGEDRDNTSNDAVKFATYTRDSVSGLDYAANRYYGSGTGRFTSPDPYQASTNGTSDPTSPMSWNRYSLVQGDPVGSYDPRGLFQQVPTGGEEEGPDEGDPDYEFYYFGQAGIQTGPRYPWAASDPRRKTVLSLIKNMTKCAEFLGAKTAKALTDALNNAQIGLQNLGSIVVSASGALNSGTPANEACIGKESASGVCMGTIRITLNSNYNWWSPSDSFGTIQGTGQTTGVDLTAAVGASIGVPGLSNYELLGIVLLHELGHGLGKPQETDEQYNKDIYDNCFK